MDIFYGIDFGTTSSSAVALMDGEELQFGDEAGFPIPSIVAIDKETGQIFTGREAWEKKITLQETCECISSIKSVLDKDMVRTIAGKKWTSVDIVTQIFKKLKEKALEYKCEMDDVTVAIPVGFSAEKRGKIRIAAKNAGIEVKSFISEPTAAFFANYDALRAESTVAVFDWGGGTQDVTIISHMNGRILELASAGNNNGGDAIDEKLARRIHSKIVRKKGKNIKFEDMPFNAQDILLVNCEEAKRMLTSSDLTTINIPRYGEMGICREVLEYEWFCDIIRDDVDEAIECFKRAVDESGVGIANIDKILMVGGSTNLRPLAEEMMALYGEDKVYYPDETMWNVSTGAAKLNSLKGGYYSSQSIGIILSDDSYYEFLKKDTKIHGWSEDAIFGIVDTSKQARFVFGGSKDIENISDRFKTLTIPSYGFLQESIIVKAFIDKDMIFRVEAGSNMRSDEYKTVWEYSKLKCYYQIDN